MRIFCFIEAWDYSHKEKVSRKGAKPQRKPLDLLCGFSLRLCAFA
jgi:hypothetical protein